MSIVSGGGGRQPTVILHAHHRSDGLADALGRGLDFPVPEMGVAQRHAYIAVAEQWDTTGTGTPFITAWLANVWRRS